MATSSSPTAPPTVPAPEFHAVTFSSKDVPITAVTVFCEDKAEVTRVVNFSTSSSGVGPHEVCVISTRQGCPEVFAVGILGQRLARSLARLAARGVSDSNCSVFYTVLCMV